ncbi:MAG: S24/S26 family peptidase [Ruminococcus sp.]|nr:S24/S26 family peptidase [Ruminococcus sp.]
MNDGNSTFEAEIAKHGWLIYTNVGDSMMPLLRQGKDLLIISRKPAGRLKKYDVPLYKRDSGQYVLHRILKVRGNDYVLCGDNRWQRETGVTDRHVIGILTAVIRDDKTISVTNWKYRLYVHLWCDLFFIRAMILWLKALPRRIKRKL